MTLSETWAWLLFFTSLTLLMMCCQLYRLHRSILQYYTRKYRIKSFLYNCIGRFLHHFSTKIHFDHTSFSWRKKRSYALHMQCWPPLQPGNVDSDIIPPGFHPQQFVPTLPIQTPSHTKTQHPPTTRIIQILQYNSINYFKTSTIQDQYTYIHHSTTIAIQ